MRDMKNSSNKRLTQTFNCALDYYEYYKTSRWRLFTRAYNQYKRIILDIYTNEYSMRKDLDNNILVETNIRAS